MSEFGYRAHKRMKATYRIVTLPLASHLILLLREPQHALASMLSVGNAAESTWQSPMSNPKKGGFKQKRFKNSTDSKKKL